MWPYSVLPYGLGMPQQGYGYGMPQQNYYQPAFQWWNNPAPAPVAQQNPQDQSDDTDPNKTKQDSAAQNRQTRGGLGMMQVGMQMLAPRSVGQPSFPFPYR